MFSNKINNKYNYICENYNNFIIINFIIINFIFLIFNFIILMYLIF